jgi:hypothetical protein
LTVISGWKKILNPFGDSELDFLCALSLTPLRTEPTSLRKKKKAAGQGTETKTERKRIRTLIWDARNFGENKYTTSSLNMKNLFRATPTEEPYMLCNLYLTILERKRDSNNYCIWLSKIASHLSRNSRMVNRACMCR